MRFAWNSFRIDFDCLQTLNLFRFLCDKGLEPDKKIEKGQQQQQQHMQLKIEIGKS